MKKILVLISVLLLAVSVLALPVSAATKSDLLEEAAKSPVYKYVKVAVENAARTVEITEEQADQILPIVQRAVAAIPEDNGPTFRNPGEHHYTEEQLAIVMECIDEICEILGFTYEFVDDDYAPMHDGDYIFTVYDQDGKIIFEYDGDAVKKTSAATEIDTRVVLASAVVVLVIGVASLVLAKRRAEVR